MSATAPLLAALLAGSLPGLRALDLGPPVLFPWLAGTLCGIADAHALPPAEAALLRRFRHADRRPLVGLDRAADAALLAGAAAAWSDAPERLVRLPPGASPPGLPPDVLLLVPPGAADPDGVPKARIVLLLGAGAVVERYDLLAPPPRLDALHAALGAAAEALAAGAAAGPWLARALAIAPGMASVALLPEAGQTLRPLRSLPAAALIHDAAVPAGPEGLAMPETGRVRLLLGAPPARLRVVLRGEAAPRAALFADGRRFAARCEAHGAGETRLDTEAWPGVGAACDGAAGDAAVLGVAVPAPSAGTMLLRLEWLP